MKTATCTHTLKGHRTLSLGSAAFSHDSALVVSASNDHTGQDLGCKVGHMYPDDPLGRALSTVSFNHTGSHLLTENRRNCPRSAVCVKNLPRARDSYSLSPRLWHQPERHMDCKRFRERSLASAGISTILLSCGGLGDRNRLSLEDGSGSSGCRRRRIVNPSLPLASAPYRTQ